MRDKIITKARKFAKKFTITIPITKEEREMNDEIIQAISEHYLAGYDSRNEEVELLKSRVGNMQAALAKVASQTEYGPLLTDGAIVMVRNALWEDLTGEKR